MFNAQILINGLFLGFIYALMSGGLSLVFGVMKVFNLAHGIFYLLGAYVAYTMFYQLGFNPVIAIVASIAVSFLIGLITERILVEPVRTSGSDVMLLTFAFSIFVENIMLVLSGPEMRSMPNYYLGEFRVFGSYIGYERVLVLGATAAIFIVFWLFLSKSYFGKAIRATAQNEEGALLMGIDVRWVYRIAFALGCALAGSAGALLAPLYAIYPSMGGIPLMRAFAIVIFAGFGSIKGIIPAGLMLGVGEALFGYFVAPQLRYLIYFAIIIVTLLIRPSGLFGEKYS